MPRPKTLYITYDGIGEPLGQNQVLPYLEGLAASVDISLISFEKEDPPARLQDRVHRAGIRWEALHYHKDPPIGSTALDVARGARVARALARLDPVDIVHARSYVPALMAMKAGLTDSARFLFDMRGFWADERVEGGIWRRGCLYRLAKRYERAFLQEADAVVTLTHASVPQIQEWLNGRRVPISVIPTNTDLAAYSPEKPARERHVIWCGSLSTWYHFSLAVDLAKEIGRPFKVYTREEKVAQQYLRRADAEVQALEPRDVPKALGGGDIGLCLVRPSFSKVASAPTRFGEYLAAGMPVAVTAGVGDLSDIVKREEVGSVMTSSELKAVKRSAEELRGMAEDPDTPGRCRQAAERLFSVEAAIAQFEQIYSQLQGARS